MADDDENSSGLFGTILSLILLAILWPYILAALGIYIAYLLLLELLHWILANYLLTIGLIATLIGFYIIIKLKFISHAAHWCWEKIKPNDQEILKDNKEPLIPMQRKFIPSTNLYCYLCTKKLGVQEFELNGKYFCKSCYDKEK